jgi:hypothetical protein
MNQYDWHIAGTRSMLGACALAAGRLEVAEGLLVSAYDALRNHPDAPAARATEALDRVIHLYTEWGRTVDADRYRAMLPAVQEVLGTE